MLYCTSIRILQNVIRFSFKWQSYIKQYEKFKDRCQSKIARMIILECDRCYGLNLQTDQDERGFE